MEFRSAGTVSETLEWLTELGPEAQILAGGTDVMIQHLRGEISPSVLLHIERIGDLRGVAPDSGVVAVGPLTTHLELATHDLLRREFPAVAEAAATVGGWQTQAVGTLGGNICNASPAADMAPPLLVADTVVTLGSGRGRRTVALDDFFLGRRATVRDPDELVVGLSLCRPPARSGETYLKVGRRGAMEVAIVGLAARLWFAEDGQTVAAARLAMCSVAPRPIRVKDAEAVLTGSRLEPEAVREAGRILTGAASPIDDVRATAAYRQRVIAPLMERAVAVCRARALGGGDR